MKLYIKSNSVTYNGNPFVYEKKYLQQYIDDILSGYDDEDGVPIYGGGVYGRLFHSDMTGMDVVIISKNKESVSNITDDDFLDWLDDGEAAENSGESFDFDRFEGMPVLNDESGELVVLDTAVILEYPLEKYVTEFGVKTAKELLEYALVEFDDFYYIDPDFPKYGNHSVVIVNRSNLRF